MIARRDWAGSFRRELCSHLDTVFTVALFMTGRHRDAEELTFDTMLKAYMSLHRKPSTVDTLVWALTKLHAVHMESRTAAAAATATDRPTQPARNHDPGDTVTTRQIDTVGTSDEDRSIDQQTTEDWLTTLQRLPTSLREPLIHSVVGLSHHDIARVLDQSVDSVILSLSRARKAVEQAFARVAVPPRP